MLFRSPVSALAASQTLGAARASDRIKLSAGQVGEMPLPVDNGAWSDGAALARHLWELPGSGGPEAWLAFGSTMCAAYGVAETPVLEWWWDRHPERV